MTVFVLCGRFDHEGEEVFGVFTSRPRAEAAMDPELKRKHWVDWWVIYEVEVDAPAVPAWAEA